jgi:hypothetical protein
MEKSTNELIRRLYNSGILYKHEFWRYEAEHRLVRDTVGSEVFPPSIVKEIIFGLRMKPEHKRTLKNLLSGREWEHVEFIQTEQDGTALRLKPRPAKESDYNDTPRSLPIQ